MPSGNKTLCEEIGIPYPGGETKIERLRNLKEEYPELDEYIVVDNTKIEAQGFRYYSPDEFLKSIG